MVAVSDTSPISNLALIDRLFLLRSQFEEVWIPDAVQRELDRVPSPSARASIQQAIQAGWLRPRAVANARLAAVLVSDLDRGEAESIALATEINADVLLIDEKDGRLFARQAGIPVRGVLGILVRAKTMGTINSVQTEIHALRKQARFFVDSALEAQVLRAVEE